jgi:hypothetical protein
MIDIQICKWFQDFLYHQGGGMKRIGVCMNKGSAIETVAPMFVKNGGWRETSYFIK